MRNFRILLVEDDNDAREIMAEVLRMTGALAIVLAANAREGLERLRAKDFDLIVTDIGLPDISGLDMIDEAKAEHLIKSAAIVVCSAYNALKPQALSRGAHFLAKPVDLETFVEIVRRLADNSGRVS